MARRRQPRTSTCRQLRFCTKAHTGPVKSEEVVAATDGGLKNAFVYVKSGLPDKTWPTPATPVQLDQKGCMYMPHMIAVQTGQNIEVKNSDQTNHNIHPLPKTNQEWNESQPPGSEAKLKSFPREEVAIPVKCNIHPWMRSYISVLPHPFFAVTAMMARSPSRDCPRELILLLCGMKCSVRWTSR
jgi:plastocyanin